MLFARRRVWLLALSLLGFALHGLAQTKAPDVVVKPYNGRPTVFINGQPDALPGYSPGTTKEFYDKYMPRFYEKKLGVYLIWIDGWGVSATNRWWDGDKITHQLPPTTGASEYLPDDQLLLGDQVNHILKGDPAAAGASVISSTAGPTSTGRTTSGGTASIPTSLPPAPHWPGRDAC